MRPKLLGMENRATVGRAGWGKAQFESVAQPRRSKPESASARSTLFDASPDNLKTEGLALVLPRSSFPVLPWALR